jgi:hypothetical protein
MVGHQGQSSKMSVGTPARAWGESITARAAAIARNIEKMVCDGVMRSAAHRKVRHTGEQFWEVERPKDFSVNGMSQPIRPHTTGISPRMAGPRPDQEALR